MSAFEAWEAPPAFTVDTQPDGNGTVVLRPVGELDLATCPSLQAEVERSVGEGSPHVVLDLGGVDFLDSTGVRTLLVCRQIATVAGGSLRVLPGGQQTRRVLELCGVIPLLVEGEESSAA